jgi:hypothetical protein
MSSIILRSRRSTFSLTKVKEMLKDIVNGCYDSEVEKQKAKGYILERGLATILWALMSPSTHATFGLVSCPSGDVSELLLTPV